MTLTLPELTLPELNAVSDKQLAFANDTRAKYLADFDTMIAHKFANVEDDLKHAAGNEAEIADINARWAKRLNRFVTVRSFIATLDWASFWLDLDHDAETLTQRLYSRMVDCTLYNDTLAKWREVSGQ